MRQFIKTISETVSSWVNKPMTLTGKPKLKHIKQPHSSLRSHIEVMHDRLRIALHFIKTAKITRNGRSLQLDHLPWYFVIGPSGSGKTSMLAQSNTDYILEGRSTQAGQQAKRGLSACEWWVTPSAVLVDIPSNYITPKDKKSSSCSELWPYFLRLTKSKLNRKALGGVIIAISVEELIDRQYRDELVSYLKSRIREVQLTYGKKVPFYFTITKIDLLPGFLDFFDDLSAEELMQAWGVTMPAPPLPGSVASVFLKRFNALIRILNRQVIQRLHHERNRSAKSNIKDFPLHLERIKFEFSNILNRLTTLRVPFVVKGIYLTSAVQNCMAKRDASCPDVVSAEGEDMQVLEIMHIQDVKPNSYFIHQFIQHGILH